MKYLILMLGIALLCACKGVSNDTLIQGNVHNIGENEAFTDLRIVVREYKGQVEGIGAAKIVESVYTDNSGDFEINLNTHWARSYTLSVSDDQDKVIISGSGDGYTAYHNITNKQTNIVQFEASTYSNSQIKIINDLGYDSMYWEAQHLLIDSFEGNAMYINESHDYSEAKVPSGLRTFKTIKYLNGVETITIDTMDFEPMQTYNLEFHY